jgi:hypothetical protein
VVTPVPAARPGVMYLGACRGDTRGYPFSVSADSGF